MSVKSLVAALAVACGAGLAPAAHAAPLSPVPAIALTGATTHAVAYGCGPGWAPNRWGRCRPMYRGYGYGYGPRPFYGPRRVYGPGYGYGYGPPRPFYGPRPVFGPFY